MRELCSALLGLLLLTGAEARPDPAPPAEPALRLEQLKALAGVWESVGSEGPPLRTEYRVTAGGSAMREVMFPGSEREMTNMYHMDGEVLVLTHYDANGSQVRLRSIPQLRGPIDFELDTASGTAPGRPYLGELRLRLEDADTLVQEWSVFGTREPHLLRLNFRRRPETAPASALPASLCTPPAPASSLVQEAALPAAP